MTDTPHTNNDTPLNDDPMLTAFALGELDASSADYERIAKLIETDEQARAFVEQAKAVAGQLSASYADSDADTPLSDSQQASLAQAIDANHPGKASDDSPRIFKLPRPVLLAAGLAIAATATIATISLMDDDPQPIVQDDTTAVTGIAAITEALNAPVPVDFENAPLSEVLAYLHQKTNVGIATDWAALEARGVKRDTPVSLKADQAQPARNLLSAALQVAWSQSPHPDPAQWAMSDEGIAIGPKSKLVQARLDATAKLLADRRFSKAPVDAKLTQAKSAEAWDNGLWNEIRDKRNEAGKLVVDEALATLDAADKALSEQKFDTAAEHNAYAYHLLGRHAALLSRDQLLKPLERVGKLSQSIYDAQLAHDKAAIAELVAQAKADDTELDGYAQAMQVSIEALENDSFAAATEAVLNARVALAEKHKETDPQVLRDHALRSARLYNEINYERRASEASQFEKIANERGEIDVDRLEEDDVKRLEEVQKRLNFARQHQLEGRYDRAKGELDAALKLEPGNPAIEGLQAMIQDSVVAVEATKLHRQRELKKVNEALLNIEATTPSRELQLISGQQLQAMQGKLADGKGGAVRGVSSGTVTSDLGGIVMTTDGHWNGSVVWNDNHVGYAKDADFDTRYARGRLGGDALFNQQSSETWFGTASKPTGRMNLGLELQAGDARGKKRSSNSLDEYRDATQQYFSLLSAEAPASTSAPVPAIVSERAIAALQAHPVSPSRPVSRLERNEKAKALYAGEASVWKEAEAKRITGMVADQFDPALGPRAAAPDASLTRKQQVQQQRELFKFDKPVVDPAPEPAEEARSEGEDNKLTDAQRAQLKEAFDKRLAELAKTEPLELARIQALKDLADLERQFIEQTRIAMLPEPEMQRDAFALVNDNPFYNPADPGREMSTFSVDVDTAGYSIVRKQLMGQNRLPVAKSVRIEEMINYFDYGYDAPVIDGRALEDGVVTQASLEAYEKKQDGFAPFATDVQLTDCPWQAGNKLVRIGIQGMDVAQEERPAAHLTFLLDVSGSMSRANKLPLVKQSLKLLLDKLNAKDHVSIVVYAGASGLVLENCSATDRDKIENALNRLKSGGSTAGAAGIKLAYQTAQKHYIDGGVNRVILCTDGDFNVGISGTDQLVSLIKQKANPARDDDGKQRGVYLSVMGFGMGNLNDAMMEPLTNAGNGNYSYIDSLKEAEKVMYDQAGSTLVAIAKDVKVQIHFDPAQVLAYRLIGYENRVLANEDFDNDKVDAGDIGAGHSVTALYEIVPFENDGLFNDEEIREVRRQVEELDQAIALNQSLMQTAALTPNQTMKLAGTTRMLQQERTLAKAVLGVVAGELKDGKRAGKPIAAQAPQLPAAPPAEQPGADAGEPVEQGEAANAPVVVENEMPEGAMMEVRLRYKPVDAPAEDGTSRLIETPVFANERVPFAQADEPTRFAASVAGFGMVLRSSPHKGAADIGWVLQTAQGAMLHDPNQRRQEFLDLVKAADTLLPKEPVEPAGPDVLR